MKDFYNSILLPCNNYSEMKTCNILNAPHLVLAHIQELHYRSKVR